MNTSHRYDNIALLWVPLALVFLLAAVFFHPPSPHADEASAALSTTTPAFDFEVLYTSTGFVPSLLQVPIGARVAFRNTTDTPLYTASDPYPSHADYAAFDAGKDYLPGETYIFQFEKGGTFGYDNDDKPLDHGFIQVTDPAHVSPAVDETPPNQDATRDKLLAMFVPGDPNSIFTVFDAVEANPTLSVSCHELGHALGHEAYELYGFSDAMTFTNPNSTNHIPVEDLCAGGYMHGILEEVFAHQPELADDPGAMCADVPSENRGTCFHGVGHALMFVNKRDVSASLAGCRSLGEAADTDRCFEGVWMELFWGDTEHSGPNTLNWDPAKPLASCVDTESDAKPACFLYSSFGYFQTNPQDYAGAVALCTESGLTESDAAYCLKGVGITMISHFKGKNLEQSEPFVAGLDYTLKYAFYEGMMGYGNLSGISNDDLATACNNMQTDTDVCLAALEGSK